MSQPAKQRGNKKDNRRGGIVGRSCRAQPAAGVVPEIYEVVIECRHEAEQRAVFERMRGEGFRCRVVTL